MSKEKSQGVALAPFWNFGEASALKTFPSSGGGVASTVGAARALGFCDRILNDEMLEAVDPVIIHGEMLVGLKPMDAKFPNCFAPSPPS